MSCSSGKDQEEAMLNLAKGFEHVLRLDSTSFPADSRRSGLNNEEAEGEHIPNTALLVASAQLALVQFTVIWEAVSSTQYKNHVLLNLATHGIAHPLENVELSVICDKFPQDPLGLLHLHSRGPKDAFFLVKLWADLSLENMDPSIGENTSTGFTVSTRYEGNSVMNISCTTRICSFGNAIGEKVEHLSGIPVDRNRVVFQLPPEPLCDYLVNFIDKLSSLPDVATMIGVLENFTVLQVVSNQDTKETLLCLAYVFDVSPPDSNIGAASSVYRLVSTTESSTNL